MSDLPTVGAAMSRPWREPDLYCGDHRRLAPALAYDGGQAGALTVRAGSARAETRSAAYGCNDAFGLWADPDGGTCVLVVADGVGESAVAGRAAQGAVSAAVGSARDRLHGPTPFSERTLHAIFGDVDQTLANAHPGLASSGAMDGYFGATLVVALIDSCIPAGGSCRAVVGRVGDSTAWTIRRGHCQPIFGLVSPGAGPATACLPGHRDTFESRSTEVHDGEVIALMTDGLARGVLGEPAIPFLERMLAAPPTPLMFLSTLAARRNDRDDDRAAAVAWVGHYELRPEDRP